MTNYESFASKLNKEIYGHDTGNPKQITMQDIAKCRGSSQSIPALLLNNLKVFFKTRGEVVTDAKIRDILTKNGANSADKISKVFNDEVPKIKLGENDNETKHKIIAKDQKMAADLGEIFSHAASQLSSADGQWGRVSKDAGEAQIMASARRELEKQNPLDLLRASLFDSAFIPTQIPSLKNEGIKEHFIEYLSKQPSIPKDEAELNTVYKSFIQETMDNKELKTLAKYPSDQSQELYLLILKLEISGLKQTKEEIATRVEDMSTKDVLKSMEKSINLAKQKPINEAKLDQEIHKWSEEHPVGKEIKTLFRSDFEPFLEKAAKRKGQSEGHNFIKACLKYESAAPNEKDTLKEEIIANFISDDATQPVNLTFDAKSPLLNGSGDFNEALDAVLLLYDQVFSSVNIKNTRADFDVNLMDQRAQQKLI